MKNNGWTWNNIGERAMKIGFPMGKIACPWCGAIMSGVIEKECGWCDADMFKRRPIRVKKKGEG